MNSAILYNFRRCPYAMRARIIVHLTQFNPLVREILLKDKPDELLAISPKGTVPVLCLDEQNALTELAQQPTSALVIDESLDIARYALANFPYAANLWDTKAYLRNRAQKRVTDMFSALQYQQLLQSGHNEQVLALIAQNDQQFKPWLDKYKYADRHPALPAIEYRDNACQFLAQLEARLSHSKQLFADSPTLADFAILPFIRQFAHVDKPWFRQAPYPRLINWLNTHLDSPLFTITMQKYPLWLDDKSRTLPFQTQ
ncbi:glutathione S-transferase [Shewanella intestini]|uniref:Glutathione S-transferase n=1 Tax=Shewanella intestini TaxID=2017544 RepID=A0ABS5I6R2_9GAMM|nr:MULTISPECIES: glutathione S-transferase [Shewanella]MBR9729035.1 glutathione S-transferase [Shewanella intestini]MRG36899.1 glutathione S-transferase [Shewanella sp. XMDDZSB0408]